MGAKKPTDSVIDKDFAEVISFFKTKGIIHKTIPLSQLREAKRIHAATYSLVLWRFEIKRLPKHAKVFLDEIASDALQILPQALMGYRKTTTLLIRGIKPVQ